jgi:GR25 family glycosyltransferase involved in LPS biosynthesis
MDKALQQLAGKLQGDLFFDKTMRTLYATDASSYREMPLAVATPKSKADIATLISYAAANNTSLIPRTAGTSLAGQVVGNGIVVDVSKHFTKIVELNVNEGWVKVEPGVIRDELNLFLKPHGLFFGPETSTANRAMMGGMVGNNSSGTTSIRYGVTRDKIVAIKTLINKYKKLIKFKKINFNKKNVGLFNNIIINVTSVLKKNKAAIILEDDILSYDNSLEFINFFLNKEKKSNKIGSVSGYSYLDDFKINRKFQLYLSKRHSSWAWGTWSHVWSKFTSDYLEKKNSNVFKLKTPGFETLGDDMEMMLWAQKNHLINSWSVLFNYFCFKEKYKCLQPRYSLVQNIGFDNSGTHSSLRNFFKKNMILNDFILRTLWLFNINFFNVLLNLIKPLFQRIIFELKSF